MIKRKTFISYSWSSLFYFIVLFYFLFPKFVGLSKWLSKCCWIVPQTAWQSLIASNAPQLDKSLAGKSHPWGGDFKKNLSTALFSLKFPAKMALLFGLCGRNRRMSSIFWIIFWCCSRVAGWPLIGGKFNWINTFKLCCQFAAGTSNYMSYANMSCYVIWCQAAKVAEEYIKRRMKKTAGT